MMKEVEKYINQYNKECYRGVEETTPFSDLEFHIVELSHPNEFDDDEQFALHTNLGSLTVLDRMTGFGYRDVETGFRDPNGKFWLASGMYDVRHSGAKTRRAGPRCRMRSVVLSATSFPVQAVRFHVAPFPSRNS